MAIDIGQLVDLGIHVIHVQRINITAKWRTIHPLRQRCSVHGTEPDLWAF